jgi:hypothetical protein
MRTVLISSGLIVLAACNETTLVQTDPAPVVTIVSPEDDTQFEGIDTLELFAKASDNGNVEDLELTWSAAGMGVLGTIAPDSNGETYFALPAADLGEGTHALTVEVVDPGGQSGRDTVTIHIGEGAFNGEGAPTVVFTAPSSGQTFLRDDEIVFVATATDAEQAPDTLSCSLSGATGLFWEGSPTSTGNISVPYATLPVGPHIINLTCLDDDGKIGSDTVDVTINNDGRPYVTILAPLNGDVFMLDDTVTFEGEVADDEDDVELLTLEWSSDIAGVFATGVPDSSGWHALATDTLPGGIHLISLTATDTDAQWASDSILVTVQDPNDIDGDGDGYTPGDGDCDDNNYDINPGVIDICDDIDNNCDGETNEPWKDTYEANDTFDMGHELGTIDSDFGPIFSDSLFVAGLTLQHSQDEDWFWFNVDDTWFDNANINAWIDVNASGNYIIEMYWVDGSYTNWGDYNLVDSASGQGLFGTSYDSALLIDDRSDYAVRIYSTTWSAGTCIDTYDLLIERF